VVEVGLLLQEVEGFVGLWVDGLFAQVEVEPALDTYMKSF
jgi:hypothetical protein